MQAGKLGRTFGVQSLREKVACEPANGDPVSEGGRGPEVLLSLLPRFVNRGLYRSARRFPVGRAESTVGDPADRLKAPLIKSPQASTGARANCALSLARAAMS